MTNYFYYCSTYTLSTITDYNNIIKYKASINRTIIIYVKVYSGKLNQSILIQFRRV